MNKKAVLVSITLTTRVIVDTNASEEEIVNASKGNFLNQINNDEIMENLESIKDDNEIPFDVDDAIKITLSELKELNPIIEGNVKTIVFNRVKELIPNLNDDEFDSSWNETN